MRALSVFHNAQGFSAKLRLRAPAWLQRAGLGADVMGTGPSSEGARAEGVHVAFAHCKHQLKKVCPPVRVYRLVPAAVYRVVDP